MYYNFTIKDKNGVNHWFPFEFYSSRNSTRCEVENLCIIDIYKIHDHRYDFKAFFYDKKYITYQENIRSKKELYSAIQKLLQQNLYNTYSNAGKD